MRSDRAGIAGWISCLAPALLFAQRSTPLPEELREVVARFGARRDVTSEAFGFASSKAQSARRIRLWLGT